MIKNNSSTKLVFELPEEDFSELSYLESLCKGDLFSPDGSRGFAKLFLHGGKVFGIKNNLHEIIAASGLSFYDANLDITSFEKGDYVHFCNSVVHPDYRGNGYHLSMIQKRIDFLSNKSYKEISAIVHKGNFYSIRNLKKTGFKYDGPAESSLELLSYKYEQNLLKRILNLLS